MPSALELSTRLPPPDAAQRAHAERVLARVHEAIAAHGGWLPFDHYLRIVLYGPGLGYYSAGAAKFGPAGDFTTAPEISPLFGRCLARPCAQLLSAVGGGDILELGAGTGRLAAALLARLAEMGALPERYHILEVSADLRERQRATLAALPSALRSRVEWLDALPATPLAGVIVANEVADALPFRRFARSGGLVLESGVAVAPDGGLVESRRPADKALCREVERVAPADAEEAEEFRAGELCLLQEGWIAGLAATLVRGAVLLFDYGASRGELQRADRPAGTLRCHYRHRAHDDPFFLPGLQDITCWVDFTRIAEAASAAGLDVAGYCTQAAFLLATGIEAEVAGVDTAIDRARLASEARQLLLPGEMGETFKAIALTRGVDDPLVGFALQDLRRML